MKYQELRERVYKANMELVKLGLVILTWGNVSEIDREEGVIAIKPRGIEYDQLCAEDMVCVDMDGKTVDGKLLASVDLDIHLEIYRNFDDVGAIAHTHSTWATAFAQAGRDIPVLGTTHADHFYGDVPCVRMTDAGETQENYEHFIGRTIVEHFKKNEIEAMNMRGVLCAGHGPFTWGKDATEAVEFSLILEEVAKLAKISEDLGAGEKLPQYLTDKHYLRKYGKESYFYQSK